jgi:hypothetical protein
MTHQPPLSQSDFTRQPVSFILWWGLPLALGAASVELLKLPARAGAGVCAVLFVWMATGCVLNAMRCHRLHCYISGPVFLAGAIFAGLVAVGAVSVGAATFNDVVGATLILALLSFVPEMVWKRYA